MKKLGTNVFIETVYPGVNVGCIVTDEGTVCIDTPLLPAEAQRWRALIGSLEGEPIRSVVYTSAQRERILGTQYLISAQPSLPPAWKGVMPFPSLYSESDNGNKHRHPREKPVIAHESAWQQIQELRTDNFRQSMIDSLAERDPDITNLKIIPPRITLNERIEIHLGEKKVSIIAAARGMLWVWLAEQCVLFVGDTVVVGTHPALTATDSQEWLSALARLRQELEFQDAVIVPGHGSPCDLSATLPLTEYLTAARDRVQQVYQAGRPKADLNDVAAELLPLYPVADGQLERVQRQIKLGLDELYDAFKAADAD